LTSAVELTYQENFMSWGGTISGTADLDDAGPELFYFFLAEAVDGPQLRERLRPGENDAAEGGGGEDEEERQVELLGFGPAPLAEALVEGLLFGREVFG
jgi:hypothetical protein